MAPTKKNRRFEAILETNLKNFEFGFLLSDIKFPIPSKRDIAIYFWDALQPKVRALLYQALEQHDAEFIQKLDAMKNGQSKMYFLEEIKKALYGRT